MGSSPSVLILAGIAPFAGGLYLPVTERTVYTLQSDLRNNCHHHEPWHCSLTFCSTGDSGQGLGKVGGAPVEQAGPGLVWWWARGSGEEGTDVGA